MTQKAFLTQKNPPHCAQQNKIRTSRYPVFKGIILKYASAHILGGTERFNPYDSLQLKI
jgi:hypothetical protein